MKKLITLIGLMFLFVVQLKAQGGGQNDASFNVYDNGVNVDGGADSYVQALAVQQDGKILIGGSFTRFNNVSKNVIMRLNADGSVDGTFNQGGIIGTRNYLISKIICQPDGKILLCGNEFSLYNGTTVNSITRLHPDGSLDTDFNSAIVNNLTSSISPYPSVYDIALQPDGKIILVGRFDRHGSNISKNIMRINSDGSFDPTLNVGSGAGSGDNYKVNLLPDGSVFMYSPFISEYNGTPIPRCAILNSDGSLNSTYTSALINNLGANGATDLIVLPNGKMYLLGGQYLYTQNNITRKGIVRLNADLSLDLSFNFIDTVGFGFGDHILNVIPLHDGKIMVSHNLELADKILRLNEDGSVDHSFNTRTGFSYSLTGTASSTIDGLQLIPNNKLLVNGLFRYYNGTVRNGLAQIYISNDEPCAADTLTTALPGEYSCLNPLTGNVSLATNAGHQSCTPSTRDVWYNFTATQSSHIVTVTGISDFRPSVSVFSGSDCSNLSTQAIACKGGFTEAFMPFNGLTIGATYYIRVSHSSATVSASSSFTICVLSPQYDQPCTAGVLVPGPEGESTCSNPLNGNVRLATNNGIKSGCNIPNEPFNNDVWYKFVAINTSPGITVSGTGDFKANVSLYQSNDCNFPGSRIRCDNQLLGNAPFTVWYTGLTVGDTYYARVENRNIDPESTSSTNQIFTVCISPDSTFTFYVDTDGDGYGNAVNNVTNHTGVIPTGYVSDSTDCDDSNNSLHETFNFYIDADGDGYGAGSLVPACALNSTTAPVGFAGNDSDCDDNNAAIFPGSITANRPYRTKQNGDWALPSTWEQFNGCSWVTGGGAPDENVGVITISHDVVVTSAGITDGDQIVITGSGSLAINSRFFLRDGPGEDLVNNSSDGIAINGGILSGTGTVISNGRTDINGNGIIAVPFNNYGSLFFSQYYSGCCTSGEINMTDGLTTGSIDNYGTIFITAGGGGVTNMRILNGQFYNHSSGQVQANYTSIFDVAKFTNDGEFIVGVTGVSSAVCTIKSVQSSIHAGGRFKSNGNSMQYIIQTNGTFTYAADCILDWNVHFATGTHEIYSTYYGPYDTRISTTVNFNEPEIIFPGNISMDGGIFGGSAIKKIAENFYWWAGTISGGQLVINDTATGHFGAGQTSLGTLSTTLVNNGTINLVTNYGGCCIGPVLTMTNGIIENNGQFIFQPIGGGVYNETLSGGTFNNNSGGTLINNQNDGYGFSDKAIYLRNNVFSNQGTIINNGIALNIFPTSNSTIEGTVTTNAGSYTGIGISSTTTTFPSNSVINGAGTLAFQEGNHQVNTTNFNAGRTVIGISYSPANVYFNQSHVDLNFVQLNNGIMGGPATKLIKDDMVFVAGQITGGAIANTDTSVFHWGAGNPGLGAMNTAFTNNGTVEVSAYYGGCCTAPVIDLTGGSIINNGSFNVTGSGGIYYVGLSNGNFVNNPTGVINSNVSAVSFGEPAFRMQPASFTNLGTINVLQNIFALDAFTVGGIINVSANSVLRSSGTVVFNGSLINNNGNITAPIDYVNAPVKTIKGTGTFSNNMVLNNAASVTPGNSPGILTIAGNYNQGNGALTIEIGGTTPGTEHDRLGITGTATLSGTLNATEINGFNPQSFTSIDILTASSVTGTFNQVNLPPFWSVKYLSNKVSLVKFFENIYYRDADSDGYGNIADTIHRYENTAPAGYTTDNTDCNDTNGAVHPGAIEICDGIDNNCDGIVDTTGVPGLKLYLPFNNNALDASLNNHDGAVFNATLTTGHTGMANTAYQFNGSNAYIQMADHADLKPANFTVSTRFFYDNVPSGVQAILGKPLCGGWADSYGIWMQYGTLYVGWASGPTSMEYYTFGTPAAGQWHQVTLTFDDVANQAKVYIDNNLAGTFNTGVTVAYDNTPLVLGVDYENCALQFYFNGKIDETYIINRVLNLTEINNLQTPTPFIILNARYYADADGDGFGNPAVSQLACSQPSGYVLNSNDCDDTRNSVNPSAPEICDGIDNNCDGQIDGAILTTGLVAYYPFNGNANDAIGSLNGTVNGATLTTDRLGNVNSAYAFDGINDFIGLNGSFSGYNQMTVSAWYKVTTASPELQAIVSSDNSGKFIHMQIQTNTTTDNAVYIDNTNAILLNTPQPILNVWKQITITAKSGETKLYENGVLISSNTTAFSFISPANLLRIGSGYLNGRFFNGSIDEVKIYNAALTATQVLQDYNSVLQSVYYQDNDGDGFGNPTTTTTVTCGSTAPTGYVSDNTDCDDNNINIYPGVQPGTVSGTSTLCIGNTAPFTSNGNAGGTWSSSNEAVATVNQTTGLVNSISEGNTQIIYTVNTCSGPQIASQTITVVGTPVVNSVSAQSVDNGITTPVINFSGTANSYTWVNDNPAIGLAASGSGNISSFVAVNSSALPVEANITVTPVNTVSGVSCSGAPVSFTITVTPTVSFTMDEVANQIVCAQTLSSGIVFSSSTPGVTYNWTNSAPSISLAAIGTGDIPAFLCQNSGSTVITATITVTPSIGNGSGGSINGVPVSFTIRVNPMPNVNPVNDAFFCRENTTDPIVFSGIASSFTWTNNNTGIGLAANGTGDIPSFVATNIFSSPMTATITVRAYTNDGVFCEGPTGENFNITINPKPIMNNVANRIVCDGNTLGVNFSGVSVNQFAWVDNGDIIGLATAGTGTINTQVYNFNAAPYTSTITVTPNYINTITCSGDPKNFSVTVNPRPTIDQVTTQRLCLGQSTTDINFTSNVTGATFTWTNSIPGIGIGATGTGNIPSFVTTGTGNSQVAVQSSFNGCLGGTSNFSIIVDPAPVIAPISNQTFCHNSSGNTIMVGNNNFTWTNSNPEIGLAASGTSIGLGFLPTFTAVNTTNTPITASITLTPISTNPGCSGTPVSFTITVNPTPIVDPVASQFFCNENPTAIIAFTGNISGAVYNWTNNNTAIGLAASGIGDIPSFTPSILSGTVDETSSITVVPSYSNNGVNCISAGRNFNIVVRPLPILNTVSDIDVCNGSVTIVEFTSVNGLAGFYTWTNNNPSIGLAASGTGNISDFTATNTGTVPIVATITVTPFRNLVNSIDCEGLPKTFTITVYPTPTINPIASQTVCNGSTFNDINFSGSVPSTVYEWTNDNPLIGLPSSGTGNIASFLATNTGASTQVAIIRVRPRVYMNGSFACSGDLLTFFLTIKPNTVAPVITANGPTTFCGEGSVVLSTNHPGTWSVGGNSGSPTLFVNTSGTYFITNFGDGCGAAVSNSITVTINPRLQTSLSIAASATTICPGTNVTFIATPVNGGTNPQYQWSVNGVPVGNNSNTFSSNTLTGQATVECVAQSSASCVTNGQMVASIVVNVTPNLNAGVINGTTIYCIGTTATLTSSGVTGGVWASSNPSVALVNATTGFVTGLSGGYTTISYTLANQCNTISSANKIIRVVSNAAPVVIGPVNVCPFVGTNIPVKYYASLPGSRNFLWTMPPNVTILSGQFTDTIRVVFAAGFTTQANKQISVRESNGCPANSTAIYYLLIQLPGTASPIIASANNICASIGNNIPVTYTIPKVPGASNYIWLAQAATTTITHPNGTGENDTTVNVTFTSGFTNSSITVQAVNTCGISGTRSLSIAIANPGTPGLISGPSTTCNYQLPGGNNAVYSVTASAGVTYTWTVPAGVTSFTGQGTNSISFKYPAGFTNGIISVTATNGCGTSATRTKAVSTLYPATPGIIDVIQLQNCPARRFSYTIASMPSNTQLLQWTVPAGATIISGQGTTSIIVAYPNTVISGTVEVTGISNCRNSATRITKVKLPACITLFTKSNTETPVVEIKKDDTQASSDNSFSVEVFPNPSSTLFNLKIKSPIKERVEIKVMDVQGRILKIMTVSLLETIQLGASFKAGIYILEIKQDKIVTTRRLVKF